MKSHHEFSWMIGTAQQCGLFMILLLFTTFAKANPPPESELSSVVLVASDTSRVKLRAVFTRDEQGMAVRGYLTRQPLTKGPIYGHIDVEVSTKAGELILAERVDFRPNPVPRRRMERARFTWRVPP